jgi:hypothetical protein
MGWLTPEVVDAGLVLFAAVVVLGTPWLIVFCRRIAQSLGKLVGVQLTAEQLVLLDRAVEQAVAYAEAQARKKLHGLAKDGPATGAEKLELAKGVVKESVPGHSDREIEVAIEARVQKVRASTPTMMSLPPPSMPPPMSIPSIDYTSTTGTTGTPTPLRPPRKPTL